MEFPVLLRGHHPEYIPETIFAIFPPAFYKPRWEIIDEDFNFRLFRSGIFYVK